MFIMLVLISLIIKYENNTYTSFIISNTSSFCGDVLLFLPLHVGVEALDAMEIDQAVAITQAIQNIVFLKAAEFVPQALLFPDFSTRRRP